MIKVGIIGNGKIAKEHVDSYTKLAETGKAKLEVFCDLRPEAMEGLQDVRIYTDWKEMLRQEQGKLDFVDICLPTFLHKEVSITAMEWVIMFCAKSQWQERKRMQEPCWKLPGAPARP